jgi:hypothetical protein
MGYSDPSVFVPQKSELSNLARLLFRCCYSFRAGCHDLDQNTKGVDRVQFTFKTKMGSVEKSTKAKVAQTFWEKDLSM